MIDFLSVGILTVALAGCPGRSVPVSTADTLVRVGDPIAVGRAPSKVVAGDLTGDGLADLLIAATDDDRLVLLIGDGTGSFPRRETFPAGENPVDIALGDIDGDGDLDAVVANHETLHLTLLANDGSGTLTPFGSSPLQVELGPHPHAVLLFDRDGDGHLDLFVDDRQGEAILVLRGTGEGRFATDSDRIDVGGDPYRGMVLADVNLDGRIDVLTPNPDLAAVVLAQPGGGFAAPAGVAADRPFEVGAGDMNGDDVPDLVIAEEPGRIRALAGLGDGTFTGSSLYDRRWDPGAKAVATGDLNGDGLDDAAITNWSSRDALVLIGGEGDIRAIMVEAGENPWGVTIADVTGDGSSELFVLDNRGDALRVYVWREGS